MVLPPHSDGEIIYVPPHKRPRPSTLAVWKARIAKDPLVYICAWLAERGGGAAACEARTSRCRVAHADTKESSSC